MLDDAVNNSPECDQEPADFYGVPNDDGLPSIKRTLTRLRWLARSLSFPVTISPDKRGFIVWARSELRFPWDPDSSDDYRETTHGREVTYGPGQTLFKGSAEAVESWIRGRLLPSPSRDQWEQDRAEAGRLRQELGAEAAARELRRLKVARYRAKKAASASAVMADS